MFNKKKDPDYMDFDQTIIMNPATGILCNNDIYRDYEVESDYEINDNTRVRIRLRIHKSFFEDRVINIDVQGEYDDIGCEGDISDSFNGKIGIVIDKEEEE